MPIALMLAALLFGGSLHAADEPDLTEPDTIEVEVAEPERPEALVSELSNPGFEAGLAGWEQVTSPQFGGLVTADTEVKREGEASLHLISDQPGQWPWVTQVVPDIEPGATYVLSAWYRGGEQADCVAALKLEFRTPDGSLAGTALARVRVLGAEWQQLRLEGIAGFGATQARAMLRLAGEGDLWFDDVVFARTLEAPALLPAPARLVAVADQETAVQLWVAVQTPQPVETGLIRLAVLAGDRVTKTLDVEFTSGDGNLLTASPLLPGLPAGDYVVRAQFDVEEVEWPLHVTLAQRRPTGLDDHGALLRSGKPCFPVGLYHVKPEDYSRLQEQGFTAAQGPVTANPRQLTQALQAAGKSNLGLIVPLYAGGSPARRMPLIQQEMKAAGRQPAAWGWKLLDEPESRPDVANELPNAYRRLRQADKTRPFVVTVSDLDEAGTWAHFCDVLEVTALPLPEQPLGLVAERMATARKVLQPWQGLFALLQAGWSAAPGGQPTTQQARAMAYMAILNGATGIFWYALRDPGWNLAETPLWTQFGALNQEISKLGLQALTGQPLSVLVEGGAVQAAAWETPDGATIAAVNGQDVAQTVTLKLPRPVSVAQTSGELAQVQTVDGALQVTLGPAGTALIEATLAASQP